MKLATIEVENMNNKITLRYQRGKRVRSKISGTAEKPRISVFRSLRGVYAQAIDDVSGKTVAASSWKEALKKTKKNDIERAKEVGKMLAEKCAKLKIKKAVFDRNGYKYHGKIKAMAEGAREGGLEF
ncbi:MAG: large subunit ribosomal protein L18 [Parcubacteria group bacterium Athens0714_25]|nr:MAG: large subunit ribosomal protein L18 [Parcubacteria group bacterium Athens0714_25]